MISSSFCDVCGAALPIAATTCSVCGQALQTPSRSYFAQTMPNLNNPPMQRYSILMQRYRILEKIGEGGFGLVYKASDKKDNKIVAIKQINLASLSMQEIIDATDSYNREITLLPRLQHRSLPRIYDHFTDEDHWYIVMEYIKGRTLEEMLVKADAGRLPVKQVLDIGMALCDVLAYLHAQQPSIIFRDIKPANIMITDKGDIYLIDFGIARRYRAQQSRDTGSLGSPGYAAPEQYGKAQTTPQTDIYGLGATLQTLLTGKEPLEIVTEGIPLDCTIPTELQRLITHMMSRDARKRPHNMVMVGQSLANTKKHLSGLQGWFVSPFAWLATLWGLFTLLIASIFFPSSSFQIWTLYFLAGLCIAICMSTYYLYKAKQTIADKVTIKELYTIINEGLFRPLATVFWLLVMGCFYSLLPTLFYPFQLVKLLLIGFIIVNLSVMFVILKGLPWLLKWLKRKKATRKAQQSQQSASTPPLQQQMH
jgi:predicted Ser/Thr protein kinase